jgi:hypothetical protein
MVLVFSAAPILGTDQFGVTYVNAKISMSNSAALLRIPWNLQQYFHGQEVGGVPALSFLIATEVLRVPVETAKRSGSRAGSGTCEAKITTEHSSLNE